jgi:hypothetical protein
MVMLFFMIAINLRFILFAYSFIDSDCGKKYKTFYSVEEHAADPMETSVGRDTLEMYKWRGWIGLINLIILFTMFFYILKFHAFQASMCYEKIN